LRKHLVLPGLTLSASLATTISSLAQGPAGQIARECAQRDIAVITLIEDHGAADDLPADRLYSAALTQLRARSACYAGRIEEALALYDSILDLGPAQLAKR
jgi:hypothetical protein